MLIRPESTHALGGKPRIKLIRCYRDDRATALHEVLTAYPESFDQLRNGPLRGCVRAKNGSTYIAFSEKSTAILEFRRVIRVDL